MLDHSQSRLQMSKHFCFASLFFKTKSHLILKASSRPPRGLEAGGIRPYERTCVRPSRPAAHGPGFQGRAPPQTDGPRFQGRGASGLFVSNHTGEHVWGASGDL